MNAKTPGQAAYETWQDILIRSTPQIQAIPWDDLTDDAQAWWADEERRIDELSALIAEREPLTVRPADDVKAAAEPPAVRIAPCPIDSHDAEHLQIRTGSAWLCGHLIAQTLAANGIASPGEDAVSPAEHNLALEGDWPTIVAKIERERDSLARRCAVRFEETRNLRELVAEILRHLDDAGITVDDEIRDAWRERAGLEAS